LNKTEFIAVATRTPANTSPKPDLTEAKRLLEAGYKLVPLVPFTKRPRGNAWNQARNFIAEISEDATGYGLPLGLNGLCSIDPDLERAARVILDAWGFDFSALMDAGVRTSSTRPGSGGRALFLADDDLAWLRFRVKLPDGSTAIVLELRANSANLQDVGPGTVYRDQHDPDRLYTQAYANGKRVDDAGDLPEDFREFWRRMSLDNEFYREQTEIATAALIKVGIAAAGVQFVPNATDGRLPFTSTYRRAFNEAHDVETMLAEHGYTDHGRGRWSHPAATGAPGIREIPGKEGLWCTDHGGDLLPRLFDAWAIFVQLEHRGDLAAAEDMARVLDIESSWGGDAVDEFDDGYAPDVDDIDQEAEPEGKTFDLSRAVPMDPEVLSAPIPARDRLYGNMILRGFVTVIAGRGGVSKSVVLLAVAVSMAIGRDLIGLAGGYEVRPRRVLLINAEDDHDELMRRMQALLQTHKLPGADLALMQQNLVLISAYGKSVQLLRYNDGKQIAKTTALERLENTAAGFDVAIVDPLVAFHGLNENDNGEMERVISVLREVAARKRVGIVSAHHANKGGSSSDPDNAARGASAIINGARVSRFLERMDARTAEQRGIADDDRPRWIGVTDGKANYSLPAGEATWLYLSSVNVPAIDPDSGELVTESVGVPRVAQLPDPIVEEENVTLAQVVAGVLASQNIPRPFWASDSVSYRRELARLLNCGAAGRTLRRHLNDLFPEGAEWPEQVAHQGGVYYCWRASNARERNRVEYHIEAVQNRAGQLDTAGQTSCPAQ
jgi:hypothetical protein